MKLQLFKFQAQSDEQKKIVDIINRINTVLEDEITIIAADITGTSAGQLGHAQGFPLIVAPAANQVIELLSAIVVYKFGTAAFTGGGDDTSIRWAAGGAAITGVITKALLGNAAASKIHQLVPLAAAATPIPITATGLNLVAGTAYTQPGTAAGSITIKIRYKIHEVSL